MIERVDDREEWNNAVEAADFKYFTYLYEWMEVFKECLGYEMIPLGYREGGILKSVFPLMYDRKKKLLLSPPFGGCGGTTKAEHLPCYLEHVDRLAKELKAKRVLIHPAPSADLPAVLHKHGYNVNSTTPYPIVAVRGSDSEKVMMGKFKGDVRQNVRRAQREGVEITRGQANKGNVTLFYPFYGSVMKQNEAAVRFPLQLFLLIAEKMSPFVNVRIAHWHDKCIAGAMTFTYHDRIMTWFVVGLEEHRKLRANTLLFADVIKAATEEGLSFVDMGPSGWNDSNFEYKRRFGAEVETHVNAVKGYTLYDKIHICSRSWAEKQLRDRPGAYRLAVRVQKTLRRSGGKQDEKDD